MLHKNLQKLELNKIIDILTEYCISEKGKQNASVLSPSNNILEVKHLLSETTQARKMVDNMGNAPISDIQDFDKILKQLDSKIALSCNSLLVVANLLKTSRELKNYFASVEDSSVYDCIENYFQILYSNQDLENKIFRSILDENTVSDDASSNLKSIRRKKRNLEAQIKENLNKYIHSSTYSKYIMEPIITIRNDRYVIPVKIEYKDHIKGFVHDMSYSGSTVFIEPISVFEMNNEIHNLLLEENIEIERILKNLSDAIFPVRSSLNSSFEAIGNIDLIFAKAKFSFSYDCVEPIINEEKIIDLKAARHPLIDKKIVVPIDMEIGKTYTSLVITGPNTGGKTVSLKTTGLLCLMAYIGLHIPASDGSSIFVFDNVFADIGDEQSIQESLSTFSSHMLNVIDIYKESTSKSLILLDELGSGTDPIEGANLAISILEHFNNLGATVLATTHYPEIKNYALVTDGFENVSSEFDIESLKPTYKLLVGVPGKSNAFAITKRLGMPEAILTRAKSLMKTDHISIEELIKNIYDDKVEIEKELEKTKQNSNQIELLRKKLENQSSNIENKEAEIIEKAKIEAREILLNAKKNANSIIAELNNIQTSALNNALKEANSIRNELNEHIQNLTKVNDAGLTSNDSDISSLPNIQIGMHVLVKTLNQEGTVLSNPNKSGEVQLQIGSMKTNINIINLVPIKSNNSGNNKKANNGKNSAINEYSRNNSTINKSMNTSTRLKSKTATSEINVIGQTVDESIFVIDKFLDDASLAGLKTVRIVHGKGTGKLREGIHRFLKTNSHVDSFRMGTFGEGEMGVTVVSLK